MSNEHRADRASVNRLGAEQSPYLRQHAHNPVDWYPWGDEALARARAENRPILLSIGYSACHWCHVMAHESFENEAIARRMNESFVCIKVDREERPDLDQIYMDAVQLMSGRGGWPLTVFLTPAGEPFYGGTYFPPEDRHGLPGFPRVLEAIARAFREQPQDVEANVERLRRGLEGLARYQPDSTDLPPDLPQAAARAIARHFDSVNGGIGGAPKFPNTLAFSLFLRVWDADDDPGFAEMVRHTLAKMRRGGIYDQIGWGFHRYSVDERWLVPHFEKMLYDNALLARLYLDAGRALNQPEFLETAREIFDYVLREMRGSEGGFCSSQDADSEGEEGRFFLWTPAQCEAELDSRLAPIAERYLDVSAEGNFEGRNILHRTIEPEDAAKLFDLGAEEMNAALVQIRDRLFAARERRVHPARDEKVLAAWNGMMIGALAEGYRALHDERYLVAAEEAGAFVMTRLWDGGALKRSFKDGVARFNGYLEDYALMAGAFVDLYNATAEPRHLGNARALADVILERFVDSEQGGFFFTSDDHEPLITRPKPVFDGSTPSGTSAAAMTLLRLHALTGDSRYLIEAQRAMRPLRKFVEEQPAGFAHLLEAIDLYQRGATEVVLVGERDAPELVQWRERLGLLYLPNLALFVSDPREPDAAFMPEQVRNRPRKDGRLTAYVCRERACSAPLTSFKELQKELEG